MPSKREDWVPSCLPFLLILLVGFACLPVSASVASPPFRYTRGVPAPGSTELEDKALQLNNTHIYIVILKPTPQIRTLQSVEKHLNYTARARLAKQDPYVGAARTELMKHAIMFTSGLRFRTLQNASEYDAHYLLFLNAFLVRAKPADVSKISALPFVQEVWDGEQQVRPIDATPTDGNTQNLRAQAAYDWSSVTNNNWGYANIEASKIPSSGGAVKVAVVDIGFDEQHPLYNHMSANPANFVHGKVNFWATAWYGSGFDDQYGHGTEDTGVVWQVAPDAYFIGCKAPTYLYEVEGCFDWVKSQDPKVITTSLGSSGSSPNDGTGALSQSASSAADADTTVVAAAGNYGSDPPSYYPVEPGTGHYVLSVSSIDISNNLAQGASPFYSWPNWWGERKPTVAAPGWNIYTLTTVENGYAGYKFGSSFAAPHVAGIAVLLRAVSSDRVSIDAAITGSAIDVAGTALDGYGRVNARAAWDMLGPYVATDKTTYAQLESILFSGTSFTPGGSVLSCLSTDNDGSLLCSGGTYADGEGKVNEGTMQVGTNIPVGPQIFRARDDSTGRWSNAVQLTITSPVTVTVTRTVTSTVSSTSYMTRYTTTTTTSYTSTTTSTSTIPTVTTVILVPLTITSTEQSTQLLTSVLTTTTTDYTSTTTLTSTIPTTVALVPLTMTSTAQNTQYLTSVLTTTVTNYTSTETSTSTIPTLTTVILVPSSVTSTVQSTQLLTSILTTTVTSYTSTETLTSTIPTVTTVVLLPSTVTSTTQGTQYLTSILTTTVTNYTSTTTSTSTSVVYTTVTESPGGAGPAGAGASSPLAYLGFLSLLAVAVGRRVTTGKGWRIPKPQRAASVLSPREIIQPRRTFPI